MSDNPLLKTPGEMINEAREAQGLTIAQLSERTKIPPAVLASLELDEYHKISGPLYIKSFLRTCAVDLGLDPQIVLSLFNQISGENKSRPAGSEMVWNEDEVQISRVGLPWLRIIMVAGVVAVMIGIGLFALRGCGNRESALDEGSQTEMGPTEPEETATLVVQGDSEAGEDSRRESLITASTEEDLRQKAIPVEETYNDPHESLDTKSNLPDTLALGWMLSPETPIVEDDQSTSTPAEELPVETESMEKEVPAEERSMATSEPVQDVNEVVSEESSAEEAPPEPATTPEEIKPEEIVIEGPQTADPVVTRMDSSWPLVLSISCDTPQEILVKRDGDREFSEVRWPQEPEGAPALPAAGFEAGRAYRQGDRLVVFWGAEDHFSLKLARVRGVEVSINGRLWDVARLRPGQELILDAHSAASKPRP